jgi:hypothetical protein
MGEFSWHRFPFLVWPIPVEVCVYISIVLRKNTRIHGAIGELRKPEEEVHKAETRGVLVGLERDRDILKNAEDMVRNDALMKHFRV